MGEHAHSIDGEAAHFRLFGVIEVASRHQRRGRRVGATGRVAGAVERPGIEHQRPPFLARHGPEADGRLARDRRHPRRELVERGGRAETRGNRGNHAAVALPAETGRRPPASLRQLGVAPHAGCGRSVERPAVGRDGRAAPQGGCGPAACAEARGSASRRNSTTRNMTLSLAFAQPERPEALARCARLGFRVGIGS